jgi:CMP-2-keto-3-deoxyoctulosonic acid synthetase
MIKVGMPMVDGLYFEQQKLGSHNCQVLVINIVCDECLLTTRMLRDFIRNKALEDSERATGWKATYNENQGFSDDAVDAWLSTQKNLSLQEIYKVPN